MTNPILERAQNAINDMDLTQAQALLAEALIEDSNNVDAWMMLANILPPDQAHESLERVLQINPGHIEARNRLGLPALTENPETGEGSSVVIEQPRLDLEPGIEKSLGSNVQVENTGENGLSQENLIDTVEHVSEEEQVNAGTGKEAEADEDFMNLFLNQEEKPQEFSFESLEEETSGEGATESTEVQEITEEEIEALLAGMADQDTVVPVNTEGQIEATPADQTTVSTLDVEPEEADLQPVPVEKEEDSSDFFRDLFEAGTSQDVQEEIEPTAVMDEPQIESFSLDIEEDESLPGMFELEEKPQVHTGSFDLEEESIAEAEEENQKKEKRQRHTHRRSQRKIWIALAILGALIITIIGGFFWIYFYGSCGVQLVIESDQSLMDLTSRWDESMMIATRSSRVVLAEPLRRMFDIRREVDKTEVPVCLLPAKSSLQKSMYYTLDAYDKLFKYENEIEITKRLILASQQRKLFETQVDAVRYCAPLSCP